MLKIELHETGGIAAVQRTIAIEDNKIRLLDHGRLRLERTLPGPSIQGITVLARELTRQRPRRNYGRLQGRSDAMTVELDVSGEAENIRVRAVFDPNDQAPPDFWRLVKDLQNLSEAEPDPRRA